MIVEQYCAASALLLFLRKCNWAKKLLKKVDFLSWETDNNLHEAGVMRKFHVKKKDHYVIYNQLSREIRELARFAATFRNF